jgi:protein-S-isoprenylcysteine O-methyltransferase Ste14
MPTVKSILLVTAQLSTMGGILLTGPWIAHRPGWLALEIAGCLLGAWSVFAMRLDNLRILPEPGANHRLVVHGPYRLIRHPMYTAVIMAFGSLVGDHFTGLRLGIWAALVAVHVLKLGYEEGMLRSRFPGYGDYTSRTRRLIPFVW